MIWDLTPWSLLLAIATLMTAAIMGSMAWHRSQYAWRMGVLELLRFGMIAMAVVTLLQPEWLIVDEQQPESEIVVLYDDSGSMQTRDIGQVGQAMESRAEALTNYRKEATWRAPESQTKIVIEPLRKAGDRSEEAKGEGNEREEAMDVGTNLQASLESIAKRDTPTRAVVLASDGDWNVGESPLAAARALRNRNIPVYTVGVGSRQPLPDVGIARFDVPLFAVVGKPLRIPYSLASSLPDDIDVPVELTLPDGSLLTETLRLPAMGTVHGTLEWRPKQVGEATLRIKIPVDPREQVLDNNEQEVSLSMRHESLKVLMIETYPRWEYRYTRNALDRDPGVEVHSLMMHPDLKELGDGKGYLQQFPTEEALLEYDVVMLGDIGVGPHQLTEEQCLQLRKLVEKQAAGLVLMPGFRGLQRTLPATSLGDLFPVDLDPQTPKGIGGAKPAQFQLTEAGRQSLLTRFEANETENEEVWRMLPGFYWYESVEKARTGSQVLAIHERDANRFGRVPLIVTKTFGNGKVLFMGSDGAWRWRKGVEDKYHYRFWGQVVRWMAYQRTMALGDSIRLMVTPDRPKVGDVVTLQANVMGANGEPLQQGTVTVQLQSPTGDTETLTLQRAGEDAWGLFTGTFRPRAGGDWQLTTACRETNSSLKSTLSIPKTRRERVGVPARLEVLEEISQITRGRHVAIDGLSEIVTSIEQLPKPIPIERRIRLWCHPLWGGAFLILLGVFWSGRKLAGLL